MPKVKCILLDTKNGLSIVKQEFSSYQDIANLLKCDYIECVRRKIGGYLVDIYCDEEGFLKSVQEPAIITKGGNNKIIEVIVGNCLLCLHNDKGEMKSLRKVMIEPIMSGLVSILFGDKEYQCLQCCLS